MEETPKAKQRSKVKKGQVAENNPILKECTPVKAIPPQDHSTPVDCKKVSSSLAAANAEDKEVSEDEDDEHSPFHLYCTQDTLAVGWDCGSPQQRPSKRLGSKVKRKLTKGKSFMQKKQTLKACSPIEPLRPRRRFNIEKPTGDFSELIPQLQFVADLVKKIKDQDDGTARSNSCDESCVTDDRKEKGTGSVLLKTNEHSPFNSNEENLPVVAPTNGKQLLFSDTQKVEEICIASPHRDLCLARGNEREIGREAFSALLDDDADEYVLRCSQEIEENLNKNATIVCSDNSELPLRQYKSSDCVSVESKLRDPDRNSSVHVKLNSSSSKKPKSPKVGTKYYVRIKSGTPKHPKRERGRSRSSHDHSGAAERISYARTKTQSAVTSPKAPSPNEIAFDDSFDAVIQNLSEKDVEMLSQGHVVDGKDAGRVTGKGTGKPCFQKVEDGQINCKRGSIQNSATGQSSAARRLTSNNQVNRDRQRNRVNQGPALHEVCTPRINKMQFRLKVPSEMCSSHRFSDWPSTVPPLQLNELHFNKDLPRVNDEVFISQQRPSNSVPMKHSDSVQPSSSTISNSLTPNAMPKTSPQKYTSEEIQKKRLEAIKKLELKKMAVLCEKDKRCHLSKGP